MLSAAARFAAAPHYVFGAWALAIGAALFGIGGLRVDTTTASFLDRTGEEWAAYQRSLDWFGGDEFISVMISGGSPFSPESLRRITAVSTALRELPGVRRVDSISTLPLVRRDNDSVFLKPLTAPEAASSDPRALRELVNRNPIARRSLVSRDGSHFAVNVLLDRDVDGARGELVSAVEDVLGSAVEASSGVPIFRTAVNERTARELAILVPVTLAILAGLILVFFGSFAALGANLVCAAAGLAVVLGFMGALAIPVSLATMTVPTILLALGSAYSTHVINAMRVHEGDVRGALEAVGRQVVLSGVTTALGFLAMSIVRVEAIRELGLVGAFGAMVVCVASLSLAPALLALSIPPARGIFEGAGAFVSSICVRLGRRPHAVVAVWAVISLLMAGGLSRLAIDTDIISWFPVDDPVRRDYERIRSAFAGITPISVMIEATDGGSVTASEPLLAIDRLTMVLDAKSDVGSAVSVASVVRHLSEVFVGAAAVPESETAAEQLLGMAVGADYLSDLIAEDRGAASVAVRLDVNGSRRLLEVSEEIGDWWARNGPEGYRATITGIMFEFARAQQAIATGQIRGLAMAICVVAASLVLVLGSLRRAVLSIVPNVLPIVIVFGALGWLGVPLDAATACMGAVALGIAVDDTIHVGSRYARERGRGLDAEEAMARSLVATCPSLLCTTIFIVSGFAVLGFSSFVMVSHFGIIAACVVALCLLADVSLLPALLVLGDEEGSV